MKADSVSDTVSIYVKFCNKRPQTKDMDSSQSTKNYWLRVGPFIS